MVEFMFIKIQCFQHILLNTCRQMRLKYENYSLRRMEVLDIKTTLTQQKPHCKNYWWNYNKNESFKPYLGNKEQKWLFLVVFLSDVHINYYFARTLFFGMPNRACPAVLFMTFFICLHNKLSSIHSIIT